MQIAYLSRAVHRGLKIAPAAAIATGVRVWPSVATLP